MARTLSVVAQQPLFRLLIAAAAVWALAAPLAMSQETLAEETAAEQSVRVTTTQPQVIHNPFARPGAERSDANAPSTITVKPPSSSAGPAAGPPLRLPGTTIPVLPPTGPTTYRNPFAAGLPGLTIPPPASTPIMPGPISRWRRSVSVPDDDSSVKSAILAAEVEPASSVEPVDSIERASVPWDRLPPAERLRDRHAASKAAGSSIGDRVTQRADPIRLGPTPLAQPEWMALEDEADSATTADTPSLTTPPGFDPFEAATAAATTAAEPAGFVPSQDDNARSMQQALPIEPESADVIVSDLGDSALASEALARAEAAAKIAETADELTAVTIECHGGLESGPPADVAAGLRRLAAWAYNRRGELALEIDRDQDALRDFQAAIELDADCWLALHNRGVTLAQQNKLDAALDDFSRVVELNPGLAIAYRNRGELFAALDRMDEAVRDYDRAIQHQADDASLYFARGYAYHRLGNYDRALADLNQSIQLAPDQPDAYTQRGNIHAERGDFAAAVSDLEKALQLDASRPETYRSLAWLWATCPDGRYRDAEQALAAARQAVQLAPPDDSFMLEALAAAHANAGQFGEAVQVQQQALAAAPPEFAPSLEQRLVLYQQRKAFRSGPSRAVRTASHETSSTPAPRPSPPVRSGR
jgi:tetratricopeptide (TPR) repeat protein